MCSNLIGFQLLFGRLQKTKGGGGEGADLLGVVDLVGGVGHVGEQQT